MIRIEKILYSTDFSSYSNQAYFHAVALAENHGASLTVLFVYTPDMITPGSEGDETADRRYWQNQLEQIRPVDPAIPVRHVFLEGDPAEEIVRYSRDASWWTWSSWARTAATGLEAAARGQRRREPRAGKATPPVRCWW